MLITIVRVKIKSVYMQILRMYGYRPRHAPFRCRVTHCSVRRIYVCTANLSDKYTSVRCVFTVRDVHLLWSQRYAVDGVSMLHDAHVRVKQLPLSPVQERTVFIGSCKIRLICRYISTHKLMNLFKRKLAISTTALCNANKHWRKSYI